MLACLQNWLDFFLFLFNKGLCFTPLRVHCLGKARDIRSVGQRENGALDGAESVASSLFSVGGFFCSVKFCDALKESATEGNMFQ